MRLPVSAAVPALLAAVALSACDSNKPANDAVNPELNTATTVPAQAEGANSFTEEQAREHVTKAGFTNVSALTKTDTGLWQGTAMRGQETVNISVDYRGALTTSPEGAAMPRAAGETAPGATAPAAEVQAAPAAARVSDDPAAMPGATSAEMRQTGERG